jgi:hypothetical protein
MNPILFTVYILACLTVFAQATSVSVKGTKTTMDQKVLVKMLTPLLTKYSLHEPLAYTEDGLRDILDTIQTKIIQEFRSVEKFYDGRVKEECGNQTLSHLNKMNDVFGDLPKPAATGTAVTKDTKCSAGEEGQECRTYQAYLKEQSRRRQIKEKIYNKKKAERKHKLELLSKAEAKFGNMVKNSDIKNVLDELKKEYVIADGLLQQAEDSLEVIDHSLNENDKWQKQGLLSSTLKYSKVVGTMNNLAEFVDKLDAKNKEVPDIMK